jgi:flagellar basal body rod protein FlgG
MGPQLASAAIGNHVDGLRARFTRRGTLHVNRRGSLAIAGGDPVRNATPRGYFEEAHVELTNASHNQRSATVPPKETRRVARFGSRPSGKW